MFEADIVIKEVEPPINNWCASGHCAPALFKRKGPNSNSEKMRFFNFSGKGINAIYCEACLIVAQFMAKNKRKE